MFKKILKRKLKIVINKIQLIKSFFCLLSLNNIIFNTIITITPSKTNKIERVSVKVYPVFLFLFIFSFNFS